MWTELDGDLEVGGGGLGAPDVEAAVRAQTAAPLSSQ